MVLINGIKFACQQCIKGHRSSSCKHEDRPLFEIQKRGRPITQCAHCRELRKTKKLHIKCLCATSGQCSVGNLLKNKGNKVGFKVADILNPCDCSKNSHCKCCETICSVPSTPFCRPKPPIAPSIAVELASVPELPIPTSAKTVPSCCSPKPPISPIEVHTVLLNNDTQTLPKEIKSSCCSSKNQISQQPNITNTTIAEKSSCCKSSAKPNYKEPNPLQNSMNGTQSKPSGCCSKKSPTSSQSISSGCCSSSSEKFTSNGPVNHNKICQCGCQKSALGPNPLLSVENLLNPCQCCAEGKHCICCSIPEHPTSFPFHDPIEPKLPEPAPLQSVSSSFTMSVQSVDDFYTYAQNTTSSQPCCTTLAETDKKTGCCGTSAKAKGVDTKGCANCQIECRCSETGGKCCTTKDERKEYLDTDGVPICGCGCTIPAEECRDCVKDLCTEYMLKPPTF